VADYVQSRSSIQVYPQGGNQYSPSGVKQMRFSITTTGPFVDFSSLALQAKITNNSSTSALTILGPGLGTMLQEARIFLGSVECERVSHYGRTEAMLQRLMPWEKRVQLYDEQLGYSAGSIAGDDFVSASIPAGGSKTVVWRPQALGLCQQANYIPTAFISGGGAILELLLANTAAEVCDSTGSLDWSLSDVKLLVDCVTVDAAFLTSFSKHLLSGGSLTLNPKCYSTVMYSVNSPSMQLVHARAYTRVNTAFVTFYRADANTQKQCNTFYLAATGKDMSMQTQIGERVWPDHRCDNMRQFWHRLLHAIGVANSTSTVNITAGPYESDSFIAATDFEACPGQSHGSGMSTANSQMVIDLRDLGTGGADLPTTAFVTVWHEALIEISQDGVSLAI